MQPQKMTSIGRWYFVKQRWREIVRGRDHPPVLTTLRCSPNEGSHYRCQYFVKCETATALRLRDQLKSSASVGNICILSPVTVFNSPPLQERMQTIAPIICRGTSITARGRWTFYRLPFADSFNFIVYKDSLDSLEVVFHLIMTT